MAAEHISDHDLERYYLGMVTREKELAGMEEHLLWCHICVERAEETQDYVDLIRIALPHAPEAQFASGIGKDGGHGDLSTLDRIAQHERGRTLRH